MLSVEIILFPHGTAIIHQAAAFVP